MTKVDDPLNEVEKKGGGGKKKEKKKINKTRGRRARNEVRVEGKVRYIVIMIPVYRNTISESDVITMLIL